MQRNEQKNVCSFSGGDIRLEEPARCCCHASLRLSVDNISQSNGRYAHLHHHRIRCWGHRLFQSKYASKVKILPAVIQHTVATAAITPRAVAGGTTWATVVPAVVSTPVSTTPVVVPGSSLVVTPSITSIALVAGGGLGIVSTATLEATIGALRAVKGLVDTNDPAVKSETCMRNAALEFKFTKSRPGSYS